jgi:hypothetical protein
MPPTALVALITGAAAVVAALSGAGWTMLTERLKARHAAKAAEVQRLATLEETQAETLRTAFTNAQSAVLRFGLTVSISLDMRSDRNARLDGEDLPGQIRQARVEYLAATDAVERLWPLCPVYARERIEQLSTGVTQAFSYARSVSSPTVPGEQVEEALRRRLRALSEEVFPPAPPGVQSARGARGIGGPAGATPSIPGPA